MQSGVSEIVLHDGSFCMAFNQTPSQLSSTRAGTSQSEVHKCCCGEVVQRE